MFRVGVHGVLLALGCACGRVSFTPAEDVDASPDAPCVFGPWSAATPVTATVTASGEDSPSLSPDGLSLYFMRDGQLRVTQRASSTASYGPPTVVDTLAGARRVAFSPDGADVYYSDGVSIWHARSLGGGQFADAAILSVLGSDWVGPSVSGGGTELYFASIDTAPTDRDLYRTHRLGPTTFDAPAPVTELNTSSYEAFSSVSADDLTLYFESKRDGPSRIYTATRPSLAEPFSSITAVDLGAADANEGDPWISLDGRELYATRQTDTGYDLVRATRACP
jgi:Tol biopolymer transport system component